jgi:hypothetical protein
VIAFSCALGDLHNYIGYDGYVVFVRFNTLAEAHASLDCTDSTPGNGLGAAPAGLQTGEVFQGGPVGYYCESAVDGYDQGKMVDVIVGISWTDPTRPLVGVLRATLDLPSGASSSFRFPGSVLTQLRDYWSARR